MKKKRKPPAKSEKSPAGNRPSWSGNLRFGLVNFAVQAFNARETAHVAFHQLHAACHRRIHYEKRCPVHGAVGLDEIVSGYEYARNKYVELDPSELDALRTERERALTIDTFIKPEQ